MLVGPPCPVTSKPNTNQAVSPLELHALDAAAVLFHLLPKNAISWFTGVLARIQRPRPLARWLVRTFAVMFRLNLSEAELALESYGSIEDLFTRRLKPGLRPVQGVVCSPADGFLARSAAAVQGEAIQAKGLSYDLADLAYGNESRDPGFKPAWYQTIYLAPHNYHRVHSAFTGKLVAIRHLPGQLWPVNVPFVSRILRLFVRNERLSFEFELEIGRAHV